MRAAIGVRFAPLLLLLYAVGAADGLRAAGDPPDLRRTRVRRPVHTAMYLQVAVLGLGVSALLWPGPVQWELCVPIGAVLAGGMASVQWTYYKRHM